MNAYCAGIIFGSFVILLVIFALYYYYTMIKQKNNIKRRLKLFWKITEISNPQDTHMPLLKGLQINLLRN
jgi:hypothetical protein